MAAAGFNFRKWMRLVLFWLQLLIAHMAAQASCEAWQHKK
jgi:hypothetical protein